MKLFEFFGRKKRRIEQLEKELRNKEWEFDLLKSETNNFPPYAITAIPNGQLDEIIEADNIQIMRELLNNYVRFIEQHDLKVDFAFMPISIFPKFCKLMKDDMDHGDSLWGIKFIPIEGLNSSIFISNLKSSDEYIKVNMKEKVVDISEEEINITEESMKVRGNK